ncbi:MAG: methyltransferase domain-containing protein [Gemmatimonadetes bacterium]|nr:methyltransferase domain-containing protein [Gemmatimonadota bacterium]
MAHHLRTTCRACGGTKLTAFLALGPQPLANAFLRTPAEFDAEARYPLDVYLCEDCSLVQLLDVIDPEVLFRDYIYVTGTSSTIAAHNQAYARTVIDHLGLGAGDLVVEAASNDGSLLKCFKAGGVRTLGVEPARNIAQMAREAGIDTVAEFFSTATARELRARYGPARAVIGNNVLAHVDDTRDFLQGGAEWIADDGLMITEVPYIREFMERLEYDTVYHEHLCYFSVTALMRLCEAVGLRIVRTDHHPVHGGTLRMYAGKASSPPRPRPGREGAGRGGAEVRLHHPAPLPPVRAGREEEPGAGAGAARGAQGGGEDGGGLRRAGQGQHAAQLLRHRHRPAAVHGGQVPAQGGQVHAGDAHPGAAGGDAAGAPARFRPDPGLELRRGDHGAAAGVPEPRGQVHRPHPRPPHLLGDAWK